VTAARLDRARAALLVVDVQERLWAVMDPAERERVARNIGVLVELARRLGFPVVLSEQYPRGLGPTVAPVEAALRGEGLDLRRLEKLEFSCGAAPGFAALWDALGRDQWIVAGMETHICVYQTARDLVLRGAAVHVPADAVISRSRDNRAIGLALIGGAGATVTSTETVVFDALGVAGTDDFRAMSRLVK
jgi:nicotinamidase-related amidase